jgi:crotonobetainyl-CoA:carnitine CoA-transferase CaiB-like acyl-CoA transferase
MHGTSGSDEDRPSPLRGVCILDLTTVLAGPYCTYQLALLGAEVIKLERPGQGDWARSGTRVAGIPDLSTQFVAQNAGKQSIVLDLQTDQGRAIALELIARADVVVENFSAGVADRLGIGYEAARAQRADIVYCAISGYGQDGPMARRPAYDHVIQAASGITLLTGTPESVPNRIGPPLFDYLAGMYGAFSVVAALRERDRTGLPQMIDVAMLDAAIVAMASTVSMLRNGGVEPQANGNTAASGSPASGIFETRDGLLSIAANQDAQVRRLCEVLGFPDLLQEDAFCTSDLRLRNAGAFRAHLATGLSRRTAAEWEEAFAQAHVPASKVRSVGEILAHPHIRQREVERQVTDPVTGQALAVPSIGFKWNGRSIGPKGGPPRLGQHTAAILAQFGLDVPHSPPITCKETP